MCSYSFIADHGIRKLTMPVTYPPVTYPNITPTITPIVIEPVKIDPISSDEWKKQFLKDLVDLLREAKEYDKRNNEPDCELESKKERLKAIADELEVEISFP